MTSPAAERFAISFAAAFSSGQLKRVLDHYCADAVLLDRDGREHRGHEAIARVYRPLLGLDLRMVIKPRFAAEQRNVAILSNDFEVLKGDDVQFRSTSFEVLERGLDDTWRLLLDHPYAT